MNLLRRFLPRFLFCGCLVAASAAGLASGQEGSRGAASKLKPTAVSQRKLPANEYEDVFEEPSPRETRKRSQHPASPGFVPKHERVVGAAYLQDPAVEPLPTPMEDPMGSLDPMGTGPSPRVQATPGMGAPRMTMPRGRRVQPGTNGRGAPIMMGEEFEGEMPFGGDPFEGPGCAECGGGHHGGDCAGGDCGVPCGPCGYQRDCFPCFNFLDLDLFSGVHGFTNPTNRGGTGSFGYHFGFNKGRPLPCFPCSNLSMQLGVAANFSNFEGGAFAFTPVGAAPVLATTNDNRYQMFATAGIFRRVDWGLQGGVVLDYLRDDWYAAAMDMLQIRGELSWVYPYGHELGFWFAASVNSAANQAGEVLVGGAPVAVIESWEAADLYAFFYRMRFQERGGEGRTFGGFTGDGDGLVGADIWLPINNNWSFQTDYAYLLPSDTPGAMGNENEAWNLAFNFIWSPGPCRNNAPSYNRPLFNVANNGSFIVKRRLLP